MKHKRRWEIVSRTRLHDLAAKFLQVIAGQSLRPEPKSSFTEWVYVIEFPDGHRELRTENEGSYDRKTGKPGTIVCGY